MTFSSHVDKAMPGNWTPLHFAAALHRLDVCDWILEEGCWSDMVTIGHETPLTLVGVRYFCRLCVDIWLYVSICSYT